MSDLDPRARIGAVHLTIANLHRSTTFYRERLGLIVHREEGPVAHLGAGGADLLTLVEAPDAVRTRGTTGLYHFAVLVPSRLDLARVLRQLIATNTPLQGFADHGVSEAIYLADPDGNGIEIYRDRPRSEWPVRDGQLGMGSDPLDTDSLLDELKGHDSVAGIALPTNTTVGHVHLHVRDLGEAERFYVGALGFDMMQRYGRAAVFVSAGGYHHHVAVNIWAGAGAPPPPENAIGLRHFEIRVSNADALAQVARSLGDAGVTFDANQSGITLHDPSRNGLVIVTESSGGL